MRWKRDTLVGDWCAEHGEFHASAIKNGSYWDWCVHYRAAVPVQFGVHQVEGDARTLRAAKAACEYIMANWPGVKS